MLIVQSRYLVGLRLKYGGVGIVDCFKCMDVIDMMMGYELFVVIRFCGGGFFDSQVLLWIFEVLIFGLFLDLKD